MYRTIDARFWSDPKIKKLNAQAKLLFVYLITNSHTHVSGIYHLSSATMAYESGLKNPALDTLCDTLSSAGLVRFDEENEVVWVKNMMRYQGKGEKNERSAACHLRDLHNSVLINDFLETYPQVSSHLRYPIDTPSIRSPKKNVGATPEQEQEQEQEQEINACSAKSVSEDFERFWESYPKDRRLSKGDALKAWRLALKKVSAAEILSAVAEFAASPASKKGQYVKLPATWLNKECWNDDRTAWQRTDSNGPGEDLRRVSRVSCQEGSHDAIRAKTITAESLRTGQGTTADVPPGSSEVDKRSPG